MTTPARTGPSFPTLLLLGAAVLAAHVGLLAREPELPGKVSATSAAPMPVVDTPAENAVQPVRVTQVLARAPAPTPVQRVPSSRTEAPSELRVMPDPEAFRPRAAPTQHVVAAAPEVPQVSATTGASWTIAQASTAAPSAKPSTPLPASSPPPSTTLPYEVLGQAKGFSYNASGALEWRLNGQSYEARMELSMPIVGKRTQTSRGSIGPEGLRPERFADKRSSEKAAHFERSAGRIRFSSNAPEAELLPGAQDRLSLFMQLAGLMRAKPRQEGEAIEFQVAGTGDAELWRFDVGPMEKLDLPAGAIEARKITRAPRKPHDSTVEVWLAPSLDHLPVRLRVAQSNGDVADQRLARRP